MYDQGYTDYWNYHSPESDNVDYLIGWGDAATEDALEQYARGKSDFANGYDADEYGGEDYREGYNSGEV